MDTLHHTVMQTEISNLTKRANNMLHQLEDKDISLTPLTLIRALGEFDTDVCGLHKHPTAKSIIQLPQDGLKSKWSGRVWCNPPYSSPKPWMERMCKHQNGVALVLASTGTQWFQEFCFNATGILFLAKRPKFVRLDGSPFGIMRDCALVAFGHENLMSLHNSGIAGKIISLD